MTTPSAWARRPTPCRRVDAADVLAAVRSRTRAWWRSIPAAMALATSVSGLVLPDAVPASPAGQRRHPRRRRQRLASSALPLGALAAPAARAARTTSARTRPSLKRRRRPQRQPRRPSGRRRPAGGPSRKARPAAARLPPHHPSRLPAGAPPPVVDDAIFSSDQPRRRRAAPAIGGAVGRRRCSGPATSPPAPYLEVLVDREGSVQDARVRGQAPGSDDGRYGAAHRRGAPLAVRRRRS